MIKNAWRSLGGAALIILLTFVAYIPAMRAGFVFDDLTLIRDNQLIKAGDGPYRFWFTTEALDYNPLTWSLWSLEWRLWGDGETGYHVVNVALHAMNAVLVWIILRRLLIPGAWLAALIFAVHPVNVATVAWISEGKNTLSLLFYLLAILFYLRFDEEGQRRWPRSERGWYGLALGMFLLALLSKSAAVMLPVVLLGCLWWRHGCVREKDYLRNVPFLVLSLISAIVTVYFQGKALGAPVLHPNSFASRLVAAGWVPWFYLSKALLPVDLMVIYPNWEIDASRWVSYVPGMILIAGLTLFWWKRKTWGRPLLFGLGYFAVTLFPVLGFFYQSFYRLSLVADHWQYYSITGVIALVVAGAETMCHRMGEWGRNFGKVAAWIVLILMAAATWERARLYIDDETLWRDNVARNPSAWLAHYNLGVALQQAGKMREAMECWEQAVRSKPDYAEAHYNLGLALGQAGKAKAAMGHWEEALRLQPDMAEAHYNLGVALIQLGKVPQAMGHWEQALRIKPDYAEAHYNLAIALEQAGAAREAIGHYEQALRINPDYTEARSRLARLQAVQ